jgi:hypothetical protein
MVRCAGGSTRHDGRPSLSTPAAGSAFARRARDTFEGRGWLITTDLTLCPDHRRSPDAPVPARPSPPPGREPARDAAVQPDRRVHRQGEAREVRPLRLPGPRHGRRVPPHPRGAGARPRLLREVPAPRQARAPRRADQEPRPAVPDRARPGGAGEPVRDRRAGRGAVLGAGPGRTPIHRGRVADVQPTHPALRHPAGRPATGAGRSSRTATARTPTGSCGPTWTWSRPPGAGRPRPGTRPTSCGRWSAGPAGSGSRSPPGEKHWLYEHVGKRRTLRELAAEGGRTKERGPPGDRLALGSSGRRPGCWPSRPSTAT